MKTICKISKRIKELREEKGISQQKLAEALNFKQSAISMWETGARTPDLYCLIDLCIYFQVSADYLLGLED